MNKIKKVTNLFAAALAIAVFLCGVSCGGDDDDTDSGLQRVDNKTLAAFFGIPAEAGEKTYTYDAPNDKFNTTIQLNIFRGEDPTVFGNRDELIRFEWRVGGLPAMSYYFEIDDGILYLKGFEDAQLDEELTNAGEGDKRGLREFDPPVEWFAPFANSDGSPSVQVGDFYGGESAVTFNGAVEIESIKHEIKINSMQTLTTMEETPRGIEDAYVIQYTHPFIEASGEGDRIVDLYVLEPNFGYVSADVRLMGESYSVTLSKAP